MGWKLIAFLHCGLLFSSTFNLWYCKIPSTYLYLTTITHEIRPKCNTSEHTKNVKMKHLRILTNHYNAYMKILDHVTCMLKGGGEVGLVYIIVV